jgi:hypothetical protein
MSVSAPAAVAHVVEEYKRYLRTSSRFLDPHLRGQFEEHLQGMNVLVRGPYVTLARDFERGACLRDRVTKGVLEPEDPPRCLALRGRAALPSPGAGGRSRGRRAGPLPVTSGEDGGKPTTRGAG